MSASLVYLLLLLQIQQMLTRLARDGGAKDVELLVLRHQVAPCVGRCRPELHPYGRMVLPELSRLRLPRPVVGVLRHPATLLRWHRQLLARYWTLLPCPARAAIDRPEDPRCT